MPTPNIRNPYNLSDKARQTAIDALIAHFELERGETIGVIAAGDILDKAVAAIGPHIYNTGIEHARQQLSEQFTIIEADLDALKK